MARSRRTEIGVGLLLVVSIAVCAGLALQLGSFAGLATRTHVSVALPDAAGLSEGASVSVAGVEVGTVERLELDFDRAVVHLAVDPRYGVRKGALAQVRARSVLGEKYVELVPQDPAAAVLEDGDVLQPGTPQTEIDEMVNQMGPLLASVDPEKMAELVDLFVQALEEDPERVQRMLENLDIVLDNSAKASAELPALVGEARGAIASAERTADLLSARAREVEPMMRKADGVLTDVQQATEPLPRLVGEAEATLADGRVLIGDLQGSTEQLEEILDNFGEIDKWEMRRLLREEGILIRLKPHEVIPDDGG